MNHRDAIGVLRVGGRVRRRFWQYNFTSPDCLVLIPGRIGSATYEPMASVIGEGRNFENCDRIDAVFMIAGPLPKVIAGYNFTTEDLLAEDWEAVH